MEPKTDNKDWGGIERALSVATSSKGSEASTRGESFVDLVTNFRDVCAGANCADLRLVFSKVANNAIDRPLVMPHQIQGVLKSASLSERGRVGRLAYLIHKIQEAVCVCPYVALACRADVGVWRFILLKIEDMSVEEISPANYLGLKEKLAGNVDSAVYVDDPFVLEFDMRPFTKASPKVSLKSSIGNGVSHLNKTLTMKVFGNGDAHTGMDALLKWMQGFQSCKGCSLLLDEDIIESTQSLRKALLFAHAAMARMDPGAEMNYGLIEPLGFLRGWGATVGGVRKSFQLLLDLIEAVDPVTLEELLCRLPLIFRVAIISPHGFFGQDKVLGLPDSGGQIVYILDQVRALEAELTRRLDEAGLSNLHPDIVVITRLIPNSLGTSCNERLERLRGTNHGRILRVPFRSDDGEILHNFISRFEIWPYLERFTIEATQELSIELCGELPEFIIGNYSDGNLAATLMRHEMKRSSSNHVCLATIAHALEKTKYPDADMYWNADVYEAYHFGIQTTADLISMSSSDFIVTSSYQEIAGTAATAGQYESYQYFTLPGLYRVVDGIDVFDSKFNVVSPGCDTDTYFPFSDESKRLTSAQRYIADLLYGDEQADVTVGKLVERKPIIFSMARLDAVKNLTGLANIYGNSPTLRDRCNLVIIGGVVNPALTNNKEEMAECRKMHGIIERHRLTTGFRWVVAQTDRSICGELYRSVGDTRGAFCQPAFYEAFGLTVIEAMISGLPTFATSSGGPAEIIRDGVSGFHIDPHLADEAQAKIEDFFERCHQDPSHWDDISRQAIQRIEARYTWREYSRRLTSCCAVYSFWAQLTSLERHAAHRYLELFWHSVFRPLVKGMQSTSTSEEA